MQVATITEVDIPAADVSTIFGADGDFVTKGMWPYHGAVNHPGPSPYTGRSLADNKGAVLSAAKGCSDSEKAIVLAIAMQVSNLVKTEGCTETHACYSVCILVPWKDGVNDPVTYPELVSMALRISYP